MRSTPDPSLVPSTSRRATSTCRNIDLPEEFLTYIVGSCSCWHIIVISVFCYLVVFHGINLYATEVLVPRHIKIQCKDDIEESETTSCYNWQQKLCKKLKYSNPTGVTLTQQFELVCQNKKEAQFYNALYYCGIAIGFLFIGYMADRYGRKTTLIISLFFQPCIGVLTTVTDIYSLHSAFNFLYGCVLPGSMLVSLVLTCDISSNCLRTFNLGLLCLSMAFGYALIPYVWLMFEDVSKFTLLICIPPIIGLFFMSIIHESPSWLLCKNRMTQAENVLLTVIQFNGYKISSTVGIRPIQIINFDTNCRVHFGKLLIDSSTRLPVLGLYALWFVTPFMTTIDTTRNWVKNVDILYLLSMSGLVSMLAAILSIVSCYTIKHKAALSILSAISCVIAIAVHILSYYKQGGLKDSHLVILEWINYAVSMGMYFIVINLTPRMFPTEHRCLGTGIAFAIGSFSFLLSEIIFSIYELTFFLYMCMAIVSTIITLICTSLLFSVHNRELPDLFEDSMNFKTNYKPFRWSVLRASSSTLEENEVKLVDFENGASQSLVYSIPPRFVLKKLTPTHIRTGDKRATRSDQE